MELHKKDTLVSHYTDGLIIPVNLSDVGDICHVRYDKTTFSIMCPRWMLDCNIQGIFESIKNLDFQFKSSDHRTAHQLYERVTKFTSTSHLVEFFHSRTKCRPEINVTAYIRVTVRNKTPETYVNHACLLLALEKLLFDYWCHVSFVEVAFDFSSEVEFSCISNKLFLKYSRLENWFSCNGSRSEDGNILKIPNHDSGGTKYFNSRRSSKQLKTYTVNEDIFTEIMETEDTQNLQRRRIELSFKRSFLRTQGLNTFSEILNVGTDLFFNRLELVEFDKNKICNQIRKSKIKGINKLLCSLTAGRLEKLLEKPSTEILRKLSLLLPSWSPSRIKKELGNKVEFPDFVFDSKCINNVVNKKKYLCNVSNIDKLMFSYFSGISPKNKEETLMYKNKESRPVEPKEVEPEDPKEIYDEDIYLDDELSESSKPIINYLLLS